MTTTLAVDGMSCGHCEQTVEDALRGVDGVADAIADRESGRVTVDGDVGPAALVRAVETAGYTTSV